MSPQLAAQLPFAIVIVGMFLVYGMLVRRGVLHDKNILIVGAGIGILAALLAGWSVWPEYQKGILPIPLLLFNPVAMLICSAYCVRFSYQSQRVQDLATYLIGDAKIIVRVAPPSRLPPADALLLPANTYLRSTDGTLFLYGAASGSGLAGEARKNVPVPLGKVVSSPPGNLAVGKVFLVAVSAPMGNVKADVLRKGMESAANAARKARVESVVVPLVPLRGLPFEASTEAIIGGVLQGRKAFAEIVLVVGSGRYEKAAVALADRLIGSRDDALKSSANV